MRSVPSRAERDSAALVVLDGLSVGDALGERFFGAPDRMRELIAERNLPAPPWRWTDDTLMSCSIVEALLSRQRVREPQLFRSFAEHLDLARGYGPAARELLLAGQSGRASHRSAASLFGGSGSFGNGAAMRVAPIGVWHAPDGLEAVVRSAERSAKATHTHPEGIAGAVAVAVAAAIAWRHRAGPAPDSHSFLAEVASLTAPGKVADGLREAADLQPDTPSSKAAAVLGNGSYVSAADTVPFALWAAAGRLSSFPETFWTTVAGLGDRDTTCAIACSVSVAYTGLEGIPKSWRDSREPLPDWLPTAS
jgi:ADP-ribosylglycohydrolase